jgi:hypothetical protein
MNMTGENDDKHRARIVGVLNLESKHNNKYLRVLNLNEFKKNQQYLVVGLLTE